MDAIFTPIYMRLLLRPAALTQGYGTRLVDQALLGIKVRTNK